MSELVTDYLERRLPAMAWVGARWHLTCCGACRQYFSQMRQTVRLLAESTFPSPEPEVETRFFQAVRGSDAPDPAIGD
jgi:predicted anti-sigma-YlaC factor YlaD